MVVAVVVLAVGVALLRSTLQTKLWASTSVVRILNSSSTSLLPDQNKVDPAREVQLQTVFANSNTVLQGVNKRLGGDTAKIDSVTISGDATADAIQFEVDSESKVIAQKAANAYADAYIEARRADIGSVLQTQVDKLHNDSQDLKNQIAVIDKQLADIAPPVTVDSRGVPVVAPESPQQQSLHSNRAALSVRAEETDKQAAQLEVESSVRQNGIIVLAAAQPPDVPLQPTPLKDAAVAIAIGTFLGLVLALLRAQRDDRMRTPEDVEALITPGVGVVSVPSNPAYPKNGNAPLPLEDRHSLEREAYRSLRTSLLFAHNERNARRVLVTSANQGDGKTTTAANLAVSMASSGRRVVVVDCDLRRPRMHTMFSLANEPGLVSVVRDGASLQEALKTVDLPDSPHLDVLTAGPVPYNPAELLMSSTVDLILDRLAERYDIVICDSSPLLAVADAVPLAGSTDGVVLVARAGHTRRRQFADAISQLDQVSSDVLAVVLSRVRTKNGQYATYYGPDSPPAARSPRSSSTAASGTATPRPKQGASTASILRPDASPGRSTSQG